MFDTEPSRRACVVLFTKPPRPGRVKTRLIGELSAEQAAELHGAFLGDVAEGLHRGRFAVGIAWALEAGEPIPEAPAATQDAATSDATTASVGAFLQEGEDLGARLFHGLRRAAEVFGWVAAVGSDSPELTPEILEEAFDRLAAGADVVLGPTRDGGYYLIALRRDSVRRELFDGVAWSTESVFEQTLGRCRELGLAVELSPVVDDIDVAEDLGALAERLRADEDAAPRTRAVLEAWGRLPPVEESLR